MNKIAMGMTVLVATFALSGAAMAGNEAPTSGQPVVQQVVENKKAAPETAKAAVEAKAATPTMPTDSKPVTQVTDGKKAMPEAAKPVADAKDTKKKVVQNATKNKHEVETKGAAKIDTPAPAEVKENLVKQ